MPNLKIVAAAVETQPKTLAPGITKPTKTEACRCTQPQIESRLHRGLAIFATQLFTRGVTRSVVLSASTSPPDR
ncbi:hypothetical protein N7517_007210 [Penicillium concentricum]|uniref:Uncharacterized protein n=1 Tax=Penicillium concentricum TaxID=293559 RepID=A0A9W9VC33_9EURO|nr:uncharacterized protein N7517_007210 [Penicillium concentricum]KAJ5375204.1 hypothetical protein N7517_007210 [Penicillium concentricum]